MALTQQDLVALQATADRLGMNPRDLYSIIGYETGGTFSPSKWGGKDGNYMGLIQFGPSERAQFGARPNQSFQDQLNSVERFFKARGFKPGMGLADAYSTVNAGSPGHYSASDSPGMNVMSHASKIATSPFMAQANQLFPGAPSSEFSSQVVPAGNQGSDTLFGKVSSNAAQPTQQDLINRAVQLATRRGEPYIPGQPGAGPSRGRLVDTILQQQFLGNGPAKVASGTSPAKVSSPSTQAAIPSGTYFTGTPSVQTAQVTPAGADIGDARASAEEISAYNSAHGTHFPTTGYYTKLSLGIPSSSTTAQSVKPTAQQQASMPSGTYFSGLTPSTQQASMPSGTYFSGTPATQQVAAAKPISLVDYLKVNLPSSPSSGRQISVPQQPAAQVDQSNIQAGLASAAPPPQQGLMQAMAKPQVGYTSPVSPDQQPSTLEEMLRRMFSGGVPA